jgi:hypothetical protein
MLRITLAYPRRHSPSADPFLTRVWGGWDEDLTDQQVYDAGRGWWKVGDRAERESHAVLTSRGIARQVIEITGWDPGKQSNGRRAFRGTILSPGHLLHDRYVGQPLAAASRNPVGYIADEPDTPCRCGCGEPARSLWLPGHDQRAIHDRIRRDFGGDIGSFIDWYDKCQI